MSKVYLWIAGVFLSAIIVAYAYLVLHYNIATSGENLGTMGDFVGGMLNPVLAFLSFMAVLYTIKLQSDTIKLQTKELEATNEELRLTREELSQSRKAQQDSADTLKQQRFESTFFSLLENVNISARNFTIKYSHDHGQIRGKNDDFSQIAILIYQLLKLIDNYNKEKNKHQKTETQDMEPDRTYSNILRACLNQNILYELAIHCSNENINSMDKFVKLIRDYKIFEHIKFEAEKSFRDENAMLNPILVSLVEYYGDKAFGENIYLSQAKEMLEAIK